MKTLLLTTLLLTSAAHSATDDWKKDRTVSGFTGLDVSNGIDVYLTQGNSEKLTLDVKGLAEDEVRSEVRNGMLKLYIDRPGGMNWLKNRNNSVKAYVTFRQLTKIAASGGADVYGQGVLSFNDLKLSASGGADVKLSLKADDLDINSSGGADAVLDGTARRVNVNGSGGADVDARKLTAETCNATSSGGSDVYVRATGDMSLRASGGSDIYYYGSGRVVTKQSSGGSDITRRE